MAEIKKESAHQHTQETLPQSKASQNNFLDPKHLNLFIFVFNVLLIESEIPVITRQLFLMEALSTFSIDACMKLGSMMKESLLSACPELFNVGKHYTLNSEYRAKQDSLNPLFRLNFIISHKETKPFYRYVLIGFLLKLQTKHLSVILFNEIIKNIPKPERYLIPAFEKHLLDSSVFMTYQKEEGEVLSLHNTHNFILTIRKYFQLETLQEKTKLHFVLAILKIFNPASAADLFKNIKDLFSKNIRDEIKKYLQAIKPTKNPSSTSSGFFESNPTEPKLNISIFTDIQVLLSDETLKEHYKAEMILLLFIYKKHPRMYLEKLLTNTTLTKESELYKIISIQLEPYILKEDKNNSKLENKK